MTLNNQKTASPVLVIVAFAIVYIVWGSTYFFIQMAVQGFPPMLMGALRYTTAGVLLLGWCIIKGDKVCVKKDIIHSAVSGLLMLFIATGVVIWVEKTLPSALVAIMVSANPIWFVVLDKGNWKINFKNKATLAGLFIGFGGVVLLMSEQVGKALAGTTTSQAKITGMILMLIGPAVWSAGSLYSKYKTSNSPARINTAWQMIIAGIAFIPAGMLNNEFTGLDLGNVPVRSWLSIVYLILFGSIAAFSAYVWLLKVRPVTQVSTHSYVNPVIAVLLGILFAHENISLLQIAGLVIILVSVLLINLYKYRTGLQTKKEVYKKELIPSKSIMTVSCE